MTLKQYIEKLERAGELLRIKEPVGLDLGLSAITEMMAKSAGGGKAILFEGEGLTPVLTNMMGSQKRMAMVLRDEDLSSAGERVGTMMDVVLKGEKNFWGKLKTLVGLGKIASKFPKRCRRKGSCQEIIYRGEEVDLEKLPIFKSWIGDGGKFITLPMVHTRGLDGTDNLGMYRMQVFSKNTTGMHWHLHKTGARHYAQYKAAGIARMPVTVTIGGDPIYTYSATAPLPEGISEYLLAGVMRGQKVKLVKCLTNDLWVPEDVDFVLEGYVDTAAPLVDEGPFGDHTGFYSLVDRYPVFHIEAITQRRDAIYCGTVVGVPPEEDFYIQKATERIFLEPMRRVMMPEVVDMDMPAAGVAHNLVLAQIKREYVGQGKKVINAMWGAGQMMLNKMMVITDYAFAKNGSYEEFLKNLTQKIELRRDLIFGNGPLDVLDHSSTNFAEGGKLGVDATGENFAPNGELLSTISYTLEPNNYADVAQFDESLLQRGIAILIARLQDATSEKVKRLSEKFLSDSSLGDVKLLLIVDFEFDYQNHEELLWYALGNAAIERDITLGESNQMTVDACLKNGKDWRGVRSWPMPVQVDSATMIRLKEILEKYGISTHSGFKIAKNGADAAYFWRENQR